MFKVIKEGADHFVVEGKSGSPFKVAKSGLSPSKVAKWQGMCRGGEVKPAKMAQGGEVKKPRLEMSDAARRMMAPDPPSEPFRREGESVLGAVGRHARGKVGEIAEGMVGVPGSAWGEGMNAAMAAGRSILPGGGSYEDELQNVREAREEQYPGAYSVIDPVRAKARSLALTDDTVGQAMGMAGPIAFHGSPHVFDRFSMQKVGTGEGAQAYGHGLYFTSEPKVAEAYRSTLAQPEIRFKRPDAEPRTQAQKDWIDVMRSDLVQLRDEYGRTPSTRAYLAQKQKAMRDIANQNRTAADEARAWYERRPGYEEKIAQYGETTAQDVAEFEARAQRSEELAAYVEGLSPDNVDLSAGSFHQVDIPDRLLDYDRALSDQSPEVLRALDAAGVIDRLADDLNSRAGGVYDRAEAREAVMGYTGSKMLRDMERLAGSGADDMGLRGANPAAASRALREAGIPGHRYRGDSSGVENYVVYDDAVIKPLGRYPSLAEYEKAKQAAPQGMAHGGEVQPYKLIEETDDAFTVDDGGGAFRIAKHGISPAMHERIRGYSGGGEAPSLTGDPAVDALIAAQSDPAAAPPPEIASAPVPDAPAPPLPSAPHGPLSVIDVRTGRPVTIAPPPAPAFVPGLRPWPPTGEVKAAPAGLAPVPSHAPEEVPPVAAHTPGAIVPGIITPTIDPVPASAPAPSTGLSLPGAPRVQGDLAAGRAQQAEGIDAQAKAAAAEADEQARILAETEQRRAAAQKDYETRLAGLQAKGDALYQNIIDKKVDPRRLWHAASTGSKITASIGMILGGIGSALTGGPNYAVEVIDRAIARDIDGQKTEIEKGQNLLAHNLRQTDDLRLAHQLTRADLLDSSAAQLQRAAASFAGEKAQAAATVAIGNLRAEAAKERQAVAVTQQQMAAQARLLPLQVEQAERQVAMQRLQMQALGAVLGGVGSSLDPRALALLPDDMRERVVLLPGGKAAMAPTKEDAGKVREAIEAVTEINGAIADMRAFRQAHSGGTMLPAAASAATATALALRNKMVRAMGKGLGVLNASDYELLFGMIPDPAAFFRTDNAVNAALDVLQQSSNDKMGSAIKARLIGYQDTPRVKVQGKG